MLLRERMVERAKSDPEIAALLAILADTEAELRRVRATLARRPDPDARQEVWGYDG